MDQKIASALHDKIATDLVDRGLLMEAGWQGLRSIALPADASAVQLAEMRKAFFAGAQHLFATIMGILDPNEEPTAADMRRMDLIALELEQFRREFDLVHAKPAGHG